MGVTYKIASTKEEFDQIHRLNYKTFVQEIPQHERNDEQRLIDPFHEQNTYIIACQGEKVVGMIAIRDQRPFSLDRKLERLDDYLPTHHFVCELRLLAVEKEFRQGGRIFLGLAQQVASYCLERGYDLALMSGTLRQQKLYHQMGFVPFAYAVGSTEARFQPMYLTKATYDASLAGRLQPRTVSFLPGPVPIGEEIEASLQSAAVSHRSGIFKHTMKQVRRSLCQLTEAKDVQVLVGTGSLANDCIAGQLSLLKKKGLILTNGEFGERLIDHASRAGLHFSVLEKSWGEPFRGGEVQEKIIAEEAAWLWAVQGETSTGMLNDLQMLKNVCRNTNVLLCLDAISTIGSVPLDLGDVYLASGVSGKGIGSYTGLSFVFHNTKLQPSSTLPRYIDLGLYAQKESIPFSHSSNLLQALLTALTKLDVAQRYKQLQRISSIVRQEMKKIGFSVLIAEDNAHPIIVTIPLPSTLSSQEIGDIMLSYGFRLHYESSYLKKQNWLQISFIGQGEQEVRRMLKTLSSILVKRASREA